MMVEKILSINLQNSWSFNGDYSDQIGGENLITTSSVNFGLTNDRFGNPNSALNLTSGYMVIPPGIYFQGAFTIVLWIKVQQSIANQKIVEFSNGPGSDEINFVATNPSNMPVSLLLFGGVQTKTLISNSSVSLYTWYHLAYSVDLTGYGTLYLNGQPTASGQQQVTNSITRNINYIGKRFWGEANANIFVDELRIFNGSLSSSSIYNDYIISSKAPIILTSFPSTTSSTSTESTLISTTPTTLTTSTTVTSSTATSTASTTTFSTPSTTILTSLTSTSATNLASTRSTISSSTLTNISLSTALGVLTNTLLEPLTSSIILSTLLTSDIPESEKISSASSSFEINLGSTFL